MEQSHEYRSYFTDDTSCKIELNTFICSPILAIFHTKSSLLSNVNLLIETDALLQFGSLLHLSMEAKKMSQYTILMDIIFI